jgi:predicted aspartyl protease
VNTHHLSVAFNQRVNVLPTNVGIGPAFKPGQNPPPTVEFKGLWDTGASGTVITQKVVQALGLAPIGITRTKTAAGETDAEVYLVSLKFPQSIGFVSLRVTKGDLGGGLDVLIGMDVIASGDFCVLNHGGKTELHFICPPVGSEEMHKMIRQMGKPKLPAPKPKASKTPLKPKPPRNAPCPCGSGLKYKKCCGK